MDASGNYLLMGGSGDEYDNYSVTHSDGWSSDIWVSYLVVLDKQVNTVGTAYRVNVIPGICYALFPHFYCQLGTKP